jgi:hypothetical protein
MDQADRIHPGKTIRRPPVERASSKNRVKTENKESISGGTENTERKTKMSLIKARRHQVKKSNITTCNTYH